MNARFVRDLELAIELEELRELGLTQEELDGFYEFFQKSWECVEGPNERRDN